MPDALSRQEWDRPTDRLTEETDLLPEKHQSGEGGCGGPAPQLSREKIRPQERAEEVQQPTRCKKIAKHGSEHCHEELGVIQYV